MRSTLTAIAGALTPVLFSLAALLAAAAPSLADAPVFVEGEEFVNYGWHNIGGVGIAVEACSGASQGYAAGGLDVPGEWIELKVTFERQGCYDVHVFYQAGFGDTVGFDLKLLDPSAPGGVSAVRFEAPGWGFG